MADGNRNQRRERERLITTTDFPQGFCNLSWYGVGNNVPTSEQEWRLQMMHQAAHRASLRSVVNVLLELQSVDHRKAEAIFEQMQEALWLATRATGALAEVLRSERATPEYAEDVSAESRFCAIVNASDLDGRERDLLCDPETLARAERDEDRLYTAIMEKGES